MRIDGRAHARITVTRNAPNDIGQRELFVSLDGTELVIVRVGEAVTREVEPVHGRQPGRPGDVRHRHGPLGGVPIHLTVEREAD